ncbi:hypothetical protein JOE23_002076 [Amphibacillus cookii]|nr:hypothetical protein [Amphibacillus cookii]
MDAYVVIYSTNLQAVGEERKYPLMEGSFKKIVRV